MIKQLATRQTQTRSVDLEIRGLKNTPHQLQNKGGVQERACCDHHTGKNYCCL